MTLIKREMAKGVMSFNLRKINGTSNECDININTKLKL